MGKWQDFVSKQRSDIAGIMNILVGRYGESTTSEIFLMLKGIKMKQDGKMELWNFPRILNKQEFDCFVDYVALTPGIKFTQLPAFIDEAEGISLPSGAFTFFSNFYFSSPHIH